jgi:hypothetical protein
VFAFIPCSSYMHLAVDLFQSIGNPKSSLPLFEEFLGVEGC